jgi:hypothetical protein
MLAMVVNDYAGNLTPRSALRFIASRLAPTGIVMRMTGLSSFLSVTVIAARRSLADNRVCFR